MTVAAILGSAFRRPVLDGVELRRVVVETAFGSAELFAFGGSWVIFRHGVPHRFLPNQVPWRAHTAALAAVGCRALLITSSCGVLTPDVPLFEPLLVDDLFMPDNRLPDGSSCTMFVDPGPGAGSPEQGHLVVEGGLFSAGLSERVAELSARPIAGRVVFAYVPGPRTKTPAENAWLRTTGAEVNSMSVGPEVVLANELQISTAALVVGHKYSVPGVTHGLDAGSIDGSLKRSRRSTEEIVVAFLRDAPRVPFGNRIHRL